MWIYKQLSDMGRMLRVLPALLVFLSALRETANAATFIPVPLETTTVTALQFPTQSSLYRRTRNNPLQQLNRYAVDQYAVQRNSRSSNRCGKCDDWPDRRNEDRGDRGDRDRDKYDRNDRNREDDRYGGKPNRYDDKDRGYGNNRDDNKNRGDDRHQGSHDRPPGYDRNKSSSNVDDKKWGRPDEGHRRPSDDRKGGHDDRDSHDRNRDKDRDRDRDHRDSNRDRDRDRDRDHDRDRDRNHDRDRDRNHDRDRDRDRDWDRDRDRDRDWDRDHDRDRDYDRERPHYRPRDHEYDRGNGYDNRRPPPPPYDDRYDRRPYYEEEYERRPPPPSYDRRPYYPDDRYEPRPYSPDDRDRDGWTVLKRPVYDDRRPYDDRHNDRGYGYDNRPADDRYVKGSFRPWDETYRGTSGFDNGGRGYYFASGRPEVSAAPSWGEGYDRGYASSWQYSGNKRPNSSGWHSVNDDLGGGRDQSYSSGSSWRRPVGRPGDTSYLYDRPTSARATPQLTDTTEIPSSSRSEDQGTTSTSTTLALNEST